MSRVTRILNAIEQGDARAADELLVWISGADVPLNGVPSKTPTVEELEANQDYPKPQK